MAHQIQAQMAQPTQLPDNSLFHQLFTHLPQIITAFGSAASGNIPGAAVNGLSAAQGILGGNAPVADGSTNAHEIGHSGGGGAGGGLGATMGQQVAESTNPTPVNQAPIDQSGGMGVGGAGGGAGGGASEAQATDPLGEAGQGPPIAKAPLNPHQKSIMDSLPPQLFSFLKSNPGMGGALQNFIQATQQYQT